jgi:RNA polymerase sigma factor for flagellar operon FliA
MYNAAGQLNKDQLVQRFAPLVKRIACHLMARLPASVQVDDLVQNGMLGLLDAIGRFEAGRWGLSSKPMRRSVCVVRCSTACARTTGCRAACVATIGVSKSAIARLEQENGRAPTERNLLTALGMTLAEYQKMLQDARGHQLVYLEDMVPSEARISLNITWWTKAETRRRSSKTRIFVRRWRRRSKGCQSGNADDGALLRAGSQSARVGEVMGVTESRVCQLHSQAVMRLRARLFGGGGKEATKAARHG